ncbi:helix-turn-helix domain-containing protein [Xanthomonas sp. NCPPB 3005]|uniref:helix-turn-helix domain-containing protein n=1 Tax=Xanthomonas sp. NCPPB 3005 TaxID=3240913 RepID=UPI003513D791
MDLGSRLKAARIAAGYSQGKLSELCGWDSSSRLSNYEQGTREPTLADLRLIASKVATGGYTLAQIVLGEEVPTAMPAVMRLTAAHVLEAARIVTTTLPSPRKLDPLDPLDAQMLASTIAALAHRAAPAADSATLPPFQGLEAQLAEGEAEVGIIAEAIKTQHPSQSGAQSDKPRKMSTRKG